MFGPENKITSKKILPAVVAAGVRLCVMYWIAPCALCQLVSQAAAPGETLLAVPLVPDGALPTEPAAGLAVWSSPYWLILKYEKLFVSLDCPFTIGLPLKAPGCVPCTGAAWVLSP